MKEDERCRHPDCVYRNRSDPDKSGNCNYSIIEGRSRTARLPEQLRLPANCPHYKPDGVTPPEPVTEYAWREDARRLYDAGATDREIAEELGKTSSCIATMRQRKWKLPPNKDRHGTRVRLDYERVEELYRHGLNDRQIAEKLECGIETIRKWRYKHELLPNIKGGDRK
jgi:transposase